MSTHSRLLKRLFLLVVLPLAIGATSFIFLRSDYLKKWKYDKPLRDALARQDFEMVKKLVEQGAEVNTTTQLGPVFTAPIKMAALRGDVTTIRFFLQRGAHVDYIEPVYQKRNLFAYTVTFTGNFPDDRPLEIAIKRQDEAMIKLLIEYHASLNYGDSHGHTPYALLESSCDQNPTPKCRRILKMLKDAGAKDMPDEQTL